MNIFFEKSNLEHVDTIFEWLTEPHMVEFWDNSQEHKNDILNFIQGKKQSYFYGTTMYWVGSIDTEPYCFLLSDIFQEGQNLSDHHRKNMSRSGHTIGLDFGIGNKNYLGKGLAAPTLQAFTSFYQKQIDSLADTFFIDPDENNPRAKHVYSKAGFEQVGEYDVQDGAFKGSVNYLMVKKA
jgi:RimJ/RimL family protein N-acetyltransferase